jgi:drug/metabolite transporter (DMT)-like permease
MSGWLEASAVVIAIGALSLAYAVGHTLGAQPIAFILYAMLASASATLAITGLGDDARAIALDPMSWLIGAAIILIEVFYYVTLTHVPPAHGNLILRIGIPIAMVAGWALLDRRPSPLVMAGGMIIVAAIAFVVANTAPGVRWPMTVSGVLAGLFMVVRGFAAEFHKWNRAARTVRDKLRVTGILLFVTTLLSLLLTALVAGGVAGGVLPSPRFLPGAAEMLHVPTILLGLLVGGPILALMNYLSFSSVVKITTANLMAIMAFSPVTTWLFQECGVALGLISVERPAPPLVAAMATLIAAVLLIFWADRRPGRLVKAARTRSQGGA